MVFEKVMLIYGVPKTVMGCGRDVSGEGICPTDLPCSCDTCKYEFRDYKNYWTFPCCTDEKRYIHGIKIGSHERDDLEINYKIRTTKYCNYRYIESASYVSCTGKRYGLTDINKTATYDPDFEVPDSAVKEWDKIKGDCQGIPQVYLVLDDCFYCT